MWNFVLQLYDNAEVSVVNREKIVIAGLGAALVVAIAMIAYMGTLPAGVADDLTQNMLQRQLDESRSRVQQLESQLAASEEKISMLEADLEQKTRETSLSDATFPTHNVVYVFSPDKITIVDPETMNTRVITEGISDMNWADAIATKDGKLIFINERGKHEVVVIDTHEQKIIKKIPVGERPTHMYNPHYGDEIWTHSDGEGALYIIDINTLEVTGVVPKALNATGHGKLLWSPNLGDKMYGTNTQDAAVHIIDFREKRHLGIVETCQGTHGMSYSELSGMAYFACGGPQQVSVVDPNTDTLVRNIQGGGPVWPGAYDNEMSHKERYMLSPMRGKINVIDAISSEVVGNIELPTDSTTVGHVIFHEYNGKKYAFAPDGDFPYVYVIDVEETRHIRRGIN